MKRAVVIGGPTASGKSSLAVSLARKLGGTVINADSLQIYDGLPILTAQPDAADRSKAPHVLYGAAHPNESFTAQSWREQAIQAMEEAHSDKQIPIIVGGTGFYINALLHGLSAIPHIPASARAEAESFLEAEGIDALYARLLAADPEGAVKLDAQNPQRLTRAYEVLLHTGQPISYWQAQPREGGPAGWQFLTIALLPPRETLHQHCAARMNIMQDAGVLEEVRDFAVRIDSGDVSPSVPLTHACGYMPLAAHLRGEMQLDAALEAMLVDTRQYARRQDMWFRRQWQPDITAASPLDEPIISTAEKFCSDAQA